MRVEISYDEKNDKLFFTEIRRKSINLDKFFTTKLYANKFDNFVKPEGMMKSVNSSRTFAILDFPNIKTFEDFKIWGLTKIKERKKLVKLLKEIYKLLRGVGKWR